MTRMFWINETFESDPAIDAWLDRQADEGGGHRPLAHSSGRYTSVIISSSFTSGPTFT